MKNTFIYIYIYIKNLLSCKQGECCGRHYDQKVKMRHNSQMKKERTKSPHVRKFHFQRPKVLSVAEVSVFAVQPVIWSLFLLKEHSSRCCLVIRREITSNKVLRLGLISNTLKCPSFLLICEVN
jgi:hypothetical protein